MKNVHTLYHPDDIHQYFHDVWKTALFREQHNKPGSFIYEIVDRCAKYPMFLYDFSDHPSNATPDQSKTEWAHFGAWWGGITRRTYDSAGVSDAYWLHELVHKGRMPHVPDLTFDNWSDKIFRNELDASVASELELYLRHPEFRSETFSFEIYADRFLSDREFMVRWKEDPAAMRDIVQLRRRDLMVRENRADPVEYWIHKFAQQNIAWSAIWSRRFDQVESKMAWLKTAIHRGTPSKEAMDTFLEWLQSREVTQGTEIPFPDEAEAFAGVYRLNSRHYRESIARGDLTHPVRQFIEQTYPEMSAEKALAGPVAKEVIGPLPHYSGRHDHQITNVTTLKTGSFSVIYALDPTLQNPDGGSEGDVVIVFQQRGDTGANGEARYGMFGGYTRVDDNPQRSIHKEQPDQGCARKIRDESMDDNGNPILAPDPDRLRIFIAGNDFREEPATLYTGHALELTASELSAAKSHSARMLGDLKYAERVYKAAKGEVRNVLVRPLRLADET